jgi:glucokinase
MNKHIAIGADIGGHHISCAAIDIVKNEIIPGTAKEAKVNNKASAEEILSNWTKALHASISKIDTSAIQGIGFAMPGPFDYAKGIALFTKEVQKFEHLYNVDVASEIKERLLLPDDTKLRFINDANAFGVAEAWIGIGKDACKLIALTLGTGFGSCFIEKGIPVLQGKGVAESGCLWHLPFNGGIADDSFSTRWFVNRYMKHSGKAINGVKELAVEARQGDATSLQLFREYGSRMGLFLSPWLKNYEAERLIIGGNIIGAFDLFGKYLTDSLAENNVETSVHLSGLMETAAIVGAAHLIDDDYYSKVKVVL